MARRTSFWVDTLINGNMASGGGNIVGSLMGTIDTDEAASGGLTVVRLIMCLDISPAVHYSGESYQQVDLGIGVASQEAVELGTTALSDPEDAADHPQRGWLYRCRYRVVGSSAARPETGIHIVHDYKDLRAKRKIERGQLFFHGTNTNDIGTAVTVNISGIVRALFLVS